MVSVVCWSSRTERSRRTTNGRNESRPDATRRKDNSTMVTMMSTTDERETHSTPIGRRDLIARLATTALAFTGLGAFSSRQLRAESVAPKWDERFELAVDLEIAAQEGGRYHRPYVAVWVEDESGK